MAVRVYDSKGREQVQAAAFQQPGQWEHIQTQVLSSVAQVDFVLPTGYDAFALVLTSVAPATDDVDLRGRFSNDGGATFRSGATDYAYRVNNSRSSTIQQSGGSTQIELTGGLLIGATNGISNAESLSGIIRIYSARDAGLVTLLITELAYFAGGTNLSSGVTSDGLVRAAAEDNDAFRLYMSSGNIASGKFILTGLRNS